MSRLIAIGDIHGCLAALNAVLDAIDPQPDDQIVTLGDYIDRGPDSRGVIDRLVQLGQQCRLVPLLGNHEVMLQSVLRQELRLQFWLSCGGQATLDSYRGRIENIPPGHLQFLDQCVRFHQTGRYIFLHANYDPDAPAEDQPEDVAFWQHLSDFHPAPHYSGKIVIVGHTPQLTGEILDLGHVVCIDTFCFGTGYLTAYEPDTGRCWQANKQGRVAK